MSGPVSNPVGVFALANLLLFFVCLVAFPSGAMVFVLLGVADRRIDGTIVGIPPAKTTRTGAAGSERVIPRRIATIYRHHDRIVLSSDGGSASSRRRVQA